MENASKALLIAGSILLVIALIAIGMGIFGTARDVVNQAEGQIDNITIQMHNKQFEEYEGTGIKYDKVKELLSLVASNNEKVEDSAFRVNFGYGYYTSNVGNGTFDKAKITDLTSLDYKYFNQDMKNFLQYCQKLVLNKEHLYNKGCIPVYDVKFIYSRIENGSNISDGMLKEIRIYAWHE